MSYKYVYPSIEYVLATGHYPEPLRKHVRRHPTFFRAPPVQVFHVAHGHIPVFVPLPPSYGSSRRHGDDSDAASVPRPRNKCFTVTIPSSVANKNLPPRNTTQKKVELASPTMGTSVMITSKRDHLPPSNVLHHSSECDIETTEEVVDTVSVSNASPSDVSNKTSMSESSAIAVVSDNETKPPPGLGGVNGYVRGQAPTRRKPQVSEDQDIYRKLLPAKPRPSATQSYSRPRPHASSSSKSEGSSGFSNRKYAPVQRGIRVN